MTVIAWDGRYVAADSLKCFGSSRNTKPCQKIMVREGIVFALTGSAALFEPMIKWYLSGKDPEKMPACGDDYKTTKLLVFEGGETASFYMPGLPYPDEFSAPDAWGAGADFAIGAMEAGKSAAEAVAIAIKRETYCGGPVNVIDLLEIQKDREAA
jgi:hypothetical protein